jgi:hypothetical protein
MNRAATIVHIFFNEKNNRAKILFVHTDRSLMRDMVLQEV